MLRRSRTWFIAAIFWFAVLFALSSQSRLLPPGPDFQGVDKIHHAAYFTLGGALIFLGLRFQWPGWSFLATTALTILACSAGGAFDEFHQSFVPNRSGNDIGDWMADTLGGLLGSLLGWRVHRRLNVKKASCASCESL
jgi:VanZ family protein